MHVAIGGDPAPAVALAPLAVMPDYRRSGVAAALVTAAIEQMRDAGALLMRSEEHTSELQSLMRISYAVFCLKKKKIRQGASVLRRSTRLISYEETTYTI